MQYLLLIYTNDSAVTKMSEAERGQEFAEYIAFSKSIRASGHMKAGDALDPVKTAKSVRVRDGKTTITDGPFAETKEQLGGYYLIEAKNIEEACMIGAKIPGAKHGTIEVRPIMLLPAM
jgi:hypothetical protein